ncbi:hypothetical protein BLNAU_11132 [Blattamonas nauphoetae]|uniref:Uncharacterized protein n=1 Tax=Blattamonas nauphoetae TaxID=2049346 RepID=A0ABQ9XN90_9EUKA|nr:hypothetical protein BLNAU_11132 [Blattamonas nauphoetae]
MIQSNRKITFPNRSPIAHRPRLFGTTEEPKCIVVHTNQSLPSPPRKEMHNEEMKQNRYFHPNDASLQTEPPSESEDAGRSSSDGVEKKGLSRGHSPFRIGLG